MAGYTMWGVEISGTLLYSDFFHSAKLARASIINSFMCHTQDTTPHGERVKKAWKIARSCGWRVVPVIIERRDDWLRRRNVTHEQP